MTILPRLRLSCILIMLLSMNACSTQNANTTQTNEKKISTARINTQLGMAYLEQHNTQRAKQKFLLALKEAPNVPDTWYSMGYYLEITGDKEEANQYYLKSATIAPERGDVQNNYGTFLCRNGEYEAAIKHFELAATNINYVDNSAAYENAGLCALKIPNQDLALEYFIKAQERDPERASVNMELAELYYTLGRYRLAQESLQQFLHFSPETAESKRLREKLHLKTTAVDES